MSLGTLGDGKGLIYGTPTQGGTYHFRVLVQQFILQVLVKEEKDYTIVVVGLGIHPESLPDAMEEEEYDANLYATGGLPPYTWNVVGLPSGLRWGYLNPADGTTVKLLGVPAVGTAGNYTITASVRDSTGANISRTYRLRVREPPWDFAVEVRRLAAEGGPSQAIVYLDPLMLASHTLPEDSDTGRPFIQEDIFEVRVRRISGRGNRTVSLFLFIPEATPPGVEIDMESPWTAEVGDADLVRTISTKVDTRYLVFNERFTYKDIPRTLTVRVDDVRTETHSLLITLRGLKVDIYLDPWPPCPIQVVESTSERMVDLVVGKSTIFKGRVWVMCSRRPRVDISFKIGLDLSLSEWTWPSPDVRSGTHGVSYITLNFLRTEFVLPYSGADWTTPVHRIFYVPDVHSIRDGRLSLTPFCSYPQSVPRPRETGMVGYTVYLDTEPNVSEWNEDNNLYMGTWQARETRPLKLLFVPWTYDMDEQNVALWPGWIHGTAPPYATSTAGDYFNNWAGLWGEWTPGVAVAFPCSPASFFNVSSTFLFHAREFAEYVQGTYPIAEMGITWGVVPITATWDYPNWNIDILRSTNPNSILRDVARMATIYRYDAGVAMRICGSGGQSRGVKWAVFVDVFAHQATLAHELYHLLGPMNFDDYSGYPSDPGFWVNRDQPRGFGESYFMAGFSLTFPNTLLGGTNDSSRSVPPYLDLVWESQHWIQTSMYQRLMNGWFNPELSRDPLCVLVSGGIFQNGSAYLEPFIVQNATAHLTPGTVGDYYIVFLDDGGRVLQRFGFNVTYQVFDDPSTNRTDESYFNYYLEAVSGTKRIELVDRYGRTLAFREISQSSPSLSLKSPLGGERLSTLRNDTFWVEWEGSDPDGDELYYYIAISPDNGNTWMPLAIDYSGTRFGFCPSCLEPGDQYVVSVMVSDGYNTKEVLSGAFSVGPYVELKVLSDIGGVSGSGWYLKGERANVSVSFTKKDMDGLPGLLGGYYEFEGWGGDLTSTEITAWIVMDSDKEVRAVFKADYSRPMIYAVVALAFVVTAFLVLRSRTKRLPPPPSK